MSRVNVDDLGWLSYWIAAFECSEASERERRKRLTAWVDAEIERRNGDAILRAAAKELGRPLSEVRAAKLRADAKKESAQ